MKILVLGSGAREHALAWKLSTSSKIRRVFVGPGNAGTEEVAENLPSVKPGAFETVREEVRKNGIDCVLVGPEVPLAEGVVDYLCGHGIPAIGPGKSAARLESSKAFSKAFLVRNGIPTASAVEFRDPAAFQSYVASKAGRRLVVKKSGLAAGKGVLESADTGELASFGASVLAADRLLVEEFLEGWEVSIFGLSDGKTYIVLPPCTDFKKAHDGDTGPNTGGMGSVCPVPWVDEALMGRIVREVVEPTYAAMANEGLSYAGVLYFGLMITTSGPKVLEFNVRFGDPETQVLMPMIHTDFGGLAAALVNGTLEAFQRDAASSRASAAGGRPGAALGVVLAGEGYPEASRKGALVEIAQGAPDGLTHVFHATTTRDPAGGFRTGGGRSFTVVGLGADLAEASRRAYEAVDRVRFEGGWCRRDIGAKFTGVHA